MYDNQKLAEANTAKLGRAIRDILPPGMGFALIVFQMEGDWTTYASNAERADMVRLMREMADKLDPADAGKGH